MSQGIPPKKVIGLGLGVLDQLLLWRDMKAPVRDNKIIDFATQGGGMTATALVAVARLGGAAEFWGTVGTDWMGDQILQGLEQEGISTSQVHRIEGARGPMVLVCVDQPTGERQFLYSVGFRAAEPPIGDLARLADAGCLLVDGTHAASATRAAAEARRLGVPVVADVGWINDEMRALLAHVDYAIASEACGRSLLPGDDHRAACERLRALGPTHAVITLGAEGLAALSGDQFLRLDAFPVQVVDTTGAGDVFHGAFCYGLLRSLSFERNLVFASAVAALKCRRLGGRAGIPRLDEVNQFLRERNPDWPALP